MKTSKSTPKPQIPLKDLGEKLYGKHWQTDLASKLGLSSRTIRSWVAKKNIPEGYYDQIKAIFFEKALEYMKLYAQM
jgi:hypothetical protein